MLWPDMRLMYDFYDVMNSTNTINHLENLRKYVMKITWKRLILIWDNASFHLSMTVRKYINTQKDWLTIIHLPKKAPYLNPNERKVNERIKSDVCTNRFYEHIEDQKAAISEYLDKRLEDGSNSVIVVYSMTLDLVIIWHMLTKNEPYRTMNNDLVQRKYKRMERESVLA